MKVTDDLYDEIQLFCTATFDDVVYVSHHTDKFENAMLRESPIHQTIIVQTEHLW